jgi:hypothetical protein
LPIAKRLLLFFALAGNAPSVPSRFRPPKNKLETVDQAGAPGSFPMRHSLFCAAVLSGVLSGFAQTHYTAADRKQITIQCYWTNTIAQANYFMASEWLRSEKPEDKAKAGAILRDLYGCDKYKDSTHCDRTGQEMVMDYKHDWSRVTANGLIYTISCKGKCKRKLSVGSYDAETNGKLMWITFETPDKRNVIETFEIFDVSPIKPAPDAADR